MVLFWVLCLLLTRPIFGLVGLDCCNKAQFHMCRKACLKLGMSDHNTNTHGVNTMLEYCPTDQVLFWKCMKSTLQRGYNRLADDFQRVCCPLTVSNKCTYACYNVQKKDNVVGFCSSTKDVELLKCINKHEMFERCCGAAKVSECKDACHEVIMSKTTPSFNLVSTLHNECKTSQEVLRCTESFTGFTEVLSGNNNFSICCKEGRSPICRNKCRYAFSQNVDASKLVKLLVKDCGYPFPQVSLYRCLFEVISKTSKSDERSIEEGVRGPNIIKSQCCSRAKSIACKNWCRKLFSKLSMIGHSDPMYAQCMKNPAEYDMSTCIEDVLEPCHYGCKDEMKFCSNFNNRPSELFRRCDKRADRAAETIYNNWKNGDFNFLSMRIPLKNITSCHPELWKALSCSIVIKPCSQKTNRNQICRSDCVTLLTKCMDNEGESSISAEETCMMLLPNSEQSDCVSAKKFVNAPINNLLNQVTFPCQSNPCKMNEVCSINKDCSYGKRSPNCRTYRCQPGCSIGGSTNIKIRHKELAKVLLTERIGQCYAICQCLSNEKGLTNTYALSNCVDFGCNQQRSCKVNQTMKDHKSRFKIGCNFCSCHDGELLCTNQSCDHIKDFSCGCKNIFNPICGFNGVTYPSLCHARCAGLTDRQLKPGDCASINACSPNPCPVNMKCLQHKRVCLLSDVFCPQYDCVEDSDKTAEACGDGSDNCQHSESKCKSNTFVCGLDGATYRNDCEASSHMVPVDYEGPCTQFENQVLQRRCDKVKCSPKGIKICKSHIPVGGCCPICEPYMRVLYSKREAHRHLRRITTKPLVAKDIVKQLSHLIYVSECTLRGYLSKDGDIIIIIKSNLVNGDRKQREICEREAEKLAGMINERSPILSTNYHLSIAKAAFVQYPSASRSNENRPLLEPFLSFSIVHLVVAIYGMFYIH